METVLSVCINNSYARRCDESVRNALTHLDDPTLSSQLVSEYRQIGEVRHLVGYILAGKSCTDLDIDPVSAARLNSRAAHGLRGKLQNIMTISSLNPDAVLLQRAADDIKDFLYRHDCRSSEER